MSKLKEWLKAISIDELWDALGLIIMFLLFLAMISIGCWAWFGKIGGFIK